MNKSVAVESRTSPQLHDGVEGTLVIFTFAEWQDIHGNLHYKKITLETFRNIPYVDAIHYVQEMSEHNQDSQIMYRFDISLML